MRTAPPQNPEHYDLALLAAAGIVFLGLAAAMVWVVLR